MTVRSTWRVRVGVVASAWAVASLAAVAGWAQTVDSASVGADATPPPAARAADTGRCFGIVLPSAQLLDAEPDSAEVLRALLSSYLTGPSLQTMALEARLTTQAVSEARQKSCSFVVASSLTQTRRSGRLGKLLGEAGGAALWRMPGAASTGGMLATVGAQAATSLATSTRSKDEVTFEYSVYTAEGATLLGPSREKASADADGQDIISPLVARAAEAIVAAATARPRP